MSRRCCARSEATLTRLASITLCLLAFAHARAESGSQDCADQLRHIDADQPGHTISARLLAIPPGAWFHYQKAVTAAALSHPQLAEQEALKALALAPSFAEVHLLLGLVAVNAGYASDALLRIATARALAPDLPWTHIAAAAAFNQLRRFDQAISEIESIPGAEATSWQAFYERARAETGLRNLPAALHSSERAVAVAPVGCTEARLLRANVLYLAGRTSDAVSELETYLIEDRLRLRRPQVLAALEKIRPGRTGSCGALCE